MDAGLGVTRSLATCFVDEREPVHVDHSVCQLVAQRVYGLALGYEDLNDHQWLRLDPLLATACEKRDPTGQDRFNPAHRGAALAGASTLIHPAGKPLPGHPGTFFRVCFVWFVYFAVRSTAEHRIKNAPMEGELPPARR